MLKLIFVHIPRYGVSIYICKENRCDFRIINHCDISLHYGEHLQKPIGSFCKYYR